MPHIPGVQWPLLQLSGRLLPAKFWYRENLITAMPPRSSPCRTQYNSFMKSLTSSLMPSLLTSHHQHHNIINIVMEVGDNVLERSKMLGHKWITQGYQHAEKWQILTDHAGVGCVVSWPGWAVRTVLGRKRGDWAGHENSARQLGVSSSVPTFFRLAIQRLSYKKIKH